METNKQTAALIVVAAGNSSRMGQGVNKQFLEIDQKPILIHTLEAFHEIDGIAEIIVVTRKSDIAQVQEMITNYKISKVVAVIAGGETRQDSVCHGLLYVTQEKVLIHDGARPFVTQTEILGVLDALKDHDAALPGVLMKDTVKQVDEDDMVIATPIRKTLRAALTPQGFTTEAILKAHQKVKQDGIQVTDDASVAEYAGIPVKMVAGSYENIKITTPEDFLRGEAIYYKEK